MNRISILGSTGSIGKQTIDVVRNNKNEFHIFGISGNNNIDELEQQIREFNPKIAAVMEHEKALELSRRLGKCNTEIMTGMEGLIAVATLPEVDTVVTAVVGMIGLIPTLRAIQARKNIALANKETLVTAGEIVMQEAHNQGVKIIPVDSEHSAIFQCIQGSKTEDIRRIILTASGGPFRQHSLEQLQKVTVDEALKHPKWNMGKKISIDSATLMNKGLEVIEAKWLFDIPIDQIEVVVHPQSIIHSLVEYKDSSVLAQLGCPDMRVPIQYALTYPNRIENNYEKMDFYKLGNLSFEEPNLDKFPALRLAYDSLKAGGSMPTVLNGANEELVALFLGGKISFCDISSILEKVLDQHHIEYSIDVDRIIEIDIWARTFVKNMIK
ncbi:MAG: 1-deoxy-D-xylulose-5-phosphate reductoisomerase [Anaerosolibacter sp.]|jgi:1-deoxy-D-xylulose-5-phosphate reductoisomerase|uniref:1-deoxy-D-xylulose-5-phosphate reductoisomerase n=1 Tax=Anaerosolibacter sp. TaxID=1872527 RepID=UPI0026035AC2|nr:1-deoxy-D-xylulose-5-phosphate reductoisomerase [Anaerosolibacter sp.]MDF2545877.1 1-deoxy-D-xylulose-5-phosphate reductoisomerase [Anaerosolibacter sp.]